MKRLINIQLIFLLSFMYLSCTKSKYLEAKPDQALVIPESLEDLQSLLDNINVMNGDGEGLVPVIGEMAADNYYVFKFNESTSILDHSLYTWSHFLNVPNTDRLYDWDLPYRCIFYCNVVLEGISTLSPSLSETEAYNNVKGSALFNRAHMFYQLAQVFSPVYHKANAQQDLGLPLKVHADINEQVNRASVQETYDKLILDLKEAASLLPIVPKYKTRPSKPATFALLARAYLSMGEYDSCLVYSGKCLELFNTLIDFNDNTLVNTTGPVGIRVRHNAEVIFHARVVAKNSDGLMYLPASIRVDSVLYNTYAMDDLRRTVFFRTATPGNHFKGSYDASNRNLFAGIAADEVYLMRAECNARKGMVQEAMSDVNTLLIARWRAGMFTPLTAENAEDALAIVLQERRKELIFRGLRWTDLRRLNRDEANISITRVVDGQTYVLSPNDKRFTFLIPYDVISFNMNWTQNPQ